MINKQCGGCTACCLTHSVSSLNKPEAAWCSHCSRGKGCRIYPDRPLECVVFKCDWLKPGSSDNILDRPDNSGMVFDFVEGQLVTQLLGPEAARLQQIYEARLGALDSNDHREMVVKLLADNILIYFIYLSGRKVLHVPIGMELDSKFKTAFEDAKGEIVYGP